MMQAVKEGVKTGDLQQAHLDLEKVRPVFQQLFKRNGFSMLAVALVDFHDSMELILDSANAKNAEKPWLCMSKLAPSCRPSRQS